MRKVLRRLVCRHEYGEPEIDWIDSDSPRYDEWQRTCVKCGKVDEWATYERPEPVVRA